MSLTSSDIEQDVYDLIQLSSLKTSISGKIYKSGMRPPNSKLEDVVITFLAGLGNQLQTGVVNVNTYVNNVVLDGIHVKDTIRIKALETIIKSWISGIINQKYEFELDKTMQVYEVPEISQHFINTRLKFKLINE